MEKYFLNQDQLAAACIFCGFTNSKISPRMTLSQKITFAEDRIFKDLLTKQPELQNLHDSFIKELDSLKFRNIAFCEKFAGKIQLENFTHQLFSKNYNYGTDSTRMNVFKYTLENHSPLLNVLHDFLKHYNKKDDLILFDFYFQALKDKNVDRKSLDNKEVMSNIDSFFPGYEVSFQKKKINAYLSNFPKDETLYSHIMQEMGETISKNGDLKSFWDEKLKKFPLNVQHEHHKRNITINPFLEQTGHYYKFIINPEFVIEKSQCSQSKAYNFCSVLHSTLGDFISQTFKSSNEVKESNTSSVSFNFSSEIEKESSQGFL